MLLNKIEMFPMMLSSGLLPLNIKSQEPSHVSSQLILGCVCGREFGLTSLKIHYPQCLQKFHNDEKKKPKEERKVPPEFG